MSDFLSGAMGVDDIKADAITAIAPIANKFPLIAQLLMGKWSDDGDVIRTPGSIRVFINGGRIKLQLTGQDWIKTGYVTMPEGVLDFEVIENMLADGKVDWSRSKPPKSGLTDIPH